MIMCMHPCMLTSVYACVPCFFLPQLQTQQSIGQRDRKKRQHSVLPTQVKPWAPQDLYSAPITGSSRPPGAYNNAASLYEMIAPDPNGNSTWTRRAPVQVSPESRPTGLRCTNLAIATRLKHNNQTKTYTYDKPQNN